jgi:putative sigma-54 modulation protein
MNIEITGRHFDITNPIKDYINVRVKKLPKILGDQADVHVILAIEKHRHIAEVILKSKIGKLTSVEETTDMYSSISKVLDKIEKQALKFKKKRITTKRTKGLAKVVATGNESIVGVDSDRGKVVIAKEISKKPMALEEAVMNLSQSENNFLVFRDARALTINVLYKRKDGNYGLISPEE